MIRHRRAEDHWPGGFTFRAFDDLVSRALPGHVRCASFEALPAAWQQEAWDALSADMYRRHGGMAA